MFVLSLDMTQSLSAWFDVNRIVLMWSEVINHLPWPTEPCLSASCVPNMAKCELIELQDLTPDDRIELAPSSGPPPCARPTLERWSKEKVVRMVGERVRLEDPDWLTCKPGWGHDFQPCSQTQLSWCDLCGEFIWGLYHQSLRCTRESLGDNQDHFHFCCCQDYLALRERKPIGKGCLDRETDRLESVSEIVWVCVVNTWLRYLRGNQTENQSIKSSVYLWTVSHKKQINNTQH